MSPVEDWSCATPTAVCVGWCYANVTLWDVMSRMANGRSCSLMFVNRLCSLVS